MGQCSTDKDCQFKGQKVFGGWQCKLITLQPAAKCDHLRLSHLIDAQHKTMQDKEGNTWICLLAYGLWEVYLSPVEYAKSVKMWGCEPTYVNKKEAEH